MLVSGTVEIANNSRLRLPMDFGDESRLIEGASLDSNGNLVMATNIAAYTVTCTGVTVSIPQLDYPYQLSAIFAPTATGDYTAVFSITLDDADGTIIVREAPLRVV